MKCEIKYAPNKLNEVIYPNLGVERRITGYATKQLEGHMILHGPNGTGKTSLANLLIKEIGNQHPEVERKDADELLAQPDLKKYLKQAAAYAAMTTGTTFAPVKFRSVVENDTGIRRQVEIPKRVKPWWFTTESGKLALSVRYGTKVLELAKGKVAVEVGSEKDLVPTLELIKTAVLNGELDTQIDAAANKLRDGFAQ